MEAVVAGRQLNALVDPGLPATTKLEEAAILSKTFVRSFTRRSCGRKFDLCVDVQGSVRSAVIGRMAGARRFVGSAEPRETPAAWFYGERVKIASACCGARVRVAGWCRGRSVGSGTVGVFRWTNLPGGVCVDAGSVGIG